MTSAYFTQKAGQKLAGAGVTWGIRAVLLMIASTLISLVIGLLGVNFLDDSSWCALDRFNGGLLTSRHCEKVIKGDIRIAVERQSVMRQLTHGGVAPVGSAGASAGGGVRPLSLVDQDDRSALLRLVDVSLLPELCGKPSSVGWPLASDALQLVERQCAATAGADRWDMLFGGAFKRFVVFVAIFVACVATGLLVWFSVTGSRDRAS